MSLAVLLLQGALNERHVPEMTRTYPGNLRVLFIEYAKCFPKLVNSSGR